LPGSHGATTGSKAGPALAAVLAVTLLESAPGASMIGFVSP